MSKIYIESEIKKGRTIDIRPSSRDSKVGEIISRDLYWTIVENSPSSASQVLKF